MDNLFSAKNAFYLGNYQLAIQEANSVVTTSDTNKQERDSLLYRSYIAIGKYTMVLDSIKDDSSTPVKLQAVKLLARYLASPDDREMILFTLKEWLEDDGSGNDSTLQLIAAIIYLKEDNKPDALRAIKNAVTLEQLGLSTHIYIQMNRLDLAEKTVKAMQSIDDESTLTQLVLAWVYVAKGGASIQEAGYIFQELSDKYGLTTLLLNGLAVAEMHMNNFAGAEKMLLDAIAKDASNADTLINLVVCAHNLRKNEEVIDRYMNDLTRVSPKHKFLVDFHSAFDTFDALAVSYKM